MLRQLGMRRMLIIGAVVCSLMLSSLAVVRRIAGPSAPDDTAIMKMLSAGDMRYYRPRPSGMYFVAELPAAQPSYLKPPAVHGGTLTIPIAEPNHLGLARMLVIRWTDAEKDPRNPARWEWEGRRVVSIPWWYPFFAGLILPGFYLGPWRGPWLRHRRKRRGLCPVCGYDLRVSPVRCPECGAQATPKVVEGAAA